jgi:hypothetical protein
MVYDFCRTLYVLSFELQGYNSHNKLWQSRNSLFFTRQQLQLNVSCYFTKVNRPAPDCVRVENYPLGVLDFQSKRFLKVRRSFRNAKWNWFTLHNCYIKDARQMIRHSCNNRFQEFLVQLMDHVGRCDSESYSYKPPWHRLILILQGDSNISSNL